MWRKNEQRCTFHLKLENYIPSIQIIHQMINSFLILCEWWWAWSCSTPFLLLPLSVLLPVCRNVTLISDIHERFRCVCLLSLLWYPENIDYLGLCKFGHVQIVLTNKQFFLFTIYKPTTVPSSVLYCNMQFLVGVRSEHVENTRPSTYCGNCVSISFNFNLI